MQQAQMEDIWTSKLSPFLDDIFYDATKNETPRVSVNKIRKGYKLLYKFNGTDRKVMYNRIETKLKTFIHNIDESKWIHNYDSYLRIINFLRMFFYFTLYDDEIESLLYLFYEEYLSHHLNKWYTYAIKNRSELMQHINICQYFDDKFNLSLFEKFKSYYIDNIKQEYIQKYNIIQILSLPDYIENTIQYYDECYNKEQEFSISLDKQKQFFIKYFIKPVFKQSNALFYQWLQENHPKLSLCHKFMYIDPENIIVEIYKSYLQQCMNKLSIDASIISTLITIINIENNRIHHILQNPLLYPILHQQLKEFLKNKIILNYYIHHLDKEIRQNLNVLTLDFIPYIVNKDTFINEYYNIMILRMLEKPNLPLEESIIYQLKKWMGNSQVSSIESLVRETKHNIDIQSSYSNPDPHINIFIWSKLNFKIQYKIPKIINDAYVKYCSYYSSKFGKFKFTLFMGMGQVWMRGIYTNKTYEFQMDEIQAHIIIILQEKQQISKIELESLIFQNEGDITGYINSLNGIVKYKDELYYINPYFFSNKQHIRLQRPKKQYKNEEDSSIIIKRQFIINSTIIRIMKLEKQLCHNDLLIKVRESITQFMAESRVIKQCIENLIDKEYIERDEHRIYHYIP